MAGRFPLLTDNHVRQSIVQALRSRGWEVVRAVDLFGERNDDEELLAGRRPTATSLLPATNRSM